jgi:hypothetical protein
MRARRRFLPCADGLTLEPRLPLDGDATPYDDVTVAVGPQPEVDTGSMDGMLGADPPQVDYDALLGALDSTGPITGPMPVDATSAFD